MSGSNITRRDFLVRSFSGFVLSGFAAACAVSLLKWNLGGSHQKKILSRKHGRLLPNKGERRKRFRAKPVWLASTLVLNQRTKILHWPLPELFKERNPVSSRNSQFPPVEQWRKVLGEAADAKCERRSKVIHFDCRRNARIRELLALLSITSLPEGGFQNIDEALKTLRPALQVPEKCPSWRKSTGLFPRFKRNWRLYALYAKLTCLANERDATKASSKILEAFGQDGFIDFGEYVAKDRNHGHPFASGGPSERFAEWHAKVVGKTGSGFKKNLARRIVEAKLLAEGASSSGKDTLKGEESSNLSAHLHHPRKRPFASRLRRYWKKKIDQLTRRFEPPRSKRATREMRSDTRQRQSYYPRPGCPSSMLRIFERQ